MKPFSLLFFLALVTLSSCNPQKKSEGEQRGRKEVEQREEQVEEINDEFEKNRQE